MKNIAMVLFPDFLLLDIAGPLEVFSIANRYLPADKHYRIITIGSGTGAYLKSFPELVAWLPRACEKAGRFGSICTGAFILGFGGLLAGHLPAYANLMQSYSALNAK